MKLADFNKLDSEQKKKVILLALFGVIALYAAFSFGVGPLMQRAQQSGMELDTLRDKLQRAESTVDRELKIRELLKSSEDVLQTAIREHIPPLENSLSWVAAQVYKSARDVGVEIESVADLGVLATPWSRNDEDGRAFVPYTVRIVTQCGYMELMALIRALESNNPYLCVSEIQVAAQEINVEKHRVRLSVQWPFWRDAGAVEEFSSQDGGGNEDRG